MIDSEAMLQFLLDTGLRGSIILVFAWLLAKCATKASPAWRCLLWQSAFACLAALILFTLFLPKVHVNILPMAKSGFLSEQAAMAFLNDHMLRPSITGTTQARPLLSMERALLFTWFLGLLFFSARFLVNLLSLARLIRTARPAPFSSWEKIGRQLVNRLGLTRPPRILLCKRTMTPFTLGIFKPVIVLPEEAGDWPLDRLRMVLAHEMAHVQRSDFLQLIGLQSLCAVYWFNPLLWMARKRYIREREKACDAQVIRLGECPEDYADHLLAIIRVFKRSNSGLQAALGMARPSELEGRLLSLLDKKCVLEQPSPRAKFLVAALGATFALTAGAINPWQKTSMAQSPVTGVSPWPTFSLAERTLLLEQGADAFYVQSLVDAGYTQLTPEKIRNLLAYHINPEDVIRLRDQPPPALTPLNINDRICMAVDMQLSHSKINAINIEGKTYYAMPSCTLELVSNPSLRTSNDPLTGQRVNKADSFPARYPNGRILYFASQENLNRFNGRPPHSLTEH